MKVNVLEDVLKRATSQTRYEPASGYLDGSKGLSL